MVPPVKVDGSTSGAGGRAGMMFVDVWTLIDFVISESAESPVQMGRRLAV